MTPLEEIDPALLTEVVKELKREGVSIWALIHDKGRYSPTAPKVRRIIMRLVDKGRWTQTDIARCLNRNSRTVNLVVQTELRKRNAA